METTEIFVPLFPWLLGGSRIGGTYNAYYGSCTEHPEAPAWGQKVFNYAIYIEKIDEREYLKASVYYGLQSFQNTDPDEMRTEVFECEADSLPLIRAWLNEERKTYFAA